MSAFQPSRYFVPRIWLLPGLLTAVALITCWSLLPYTRDLWKIEPRRRPILVEMERSKHPEGLLYVAPRQGELSVPLAWPCEGGRLHAELDAGAPLGVRIEEGGERLAISLPPEIPEGLHRLRLSAEGCVGDSDPRESQLLITVMPPVLPRPVLSVASGLTSAGLFAFIEGTPGARVDVLLNRPGRDGSKREESERCDSPPLVGVVHLSSRGSAGIDLPVGMEQAHLLRARQLSPLEDSQAVAASQLSAPPVLRRRTDLSDQGSTAGLRTRLIVGARELSWSWDLALPDLYLAHGGPLPTWRRLMSSSDSPVRLELGTSREGPFEPLECIRRIATVERHEGMTHFMGRCRLQSSESLRTMLFHSGARFYVFLLEEPELSLPLSFEVSLGAGAVLSDAQPPAQQVDPRAGAARFQGETADVGPYLRFGRRTLFPLVDMPEPAALLMQPARRVAEHAQRVIGLVLKLLPLMVLFPLIGHRGLTGVLLLLLLGSAAAPLSWDSAHASIVPGRRDPFHIAAAVLWEAAALGWVIAAVRSRGVLRSVSRTLLFTLLVALPITWLQLVLHSPSMAPARSGELLSLALGGVLFLAVIWGLAFLMREAGGGRGWQLLLFGISVVLLLRSGFSQHYFHVDAVAQRLVLLSPVFSVLCAIAAVRAGRAAPGDLLWPLFLAAIPPLVMDHGMPLGLLASILVYKVWRRVMPQAAKGNVPPPSPGDAVPPEVEAVLLAVGEHPVEQIHAERAQLLSRARRGEVLSNAYKLALQLLDQREAAAEAKGYQRDYHRLPNVLSAATRDGPLSDGLRGIRAAVPPMILYFLFLLLVNEPFDPGRLLRQLLSSLRLPLELGSMCFFFGFAFGSLPGKNGLVKGMLATLLTIACELPAAVLTWYRPEDVGRGLVRWVGVLGILGWVGLVGFDLHRLRMAGLGLLDLRRVSGYSRGFALTTSIILGIFTAVVGGVTGRISSLLSGAVAGIESRAPQPAGSPDEEPAPLDPIRE